MKHYNVVAAVICYEGKYLCMRKGNTKYAYTSFKYEFPGGKIEPGETPEEALQRELREEMNYEVHVGEHLVTVEHIYPDFSISLMAYLCTADNPMFRMNEHVGYAWREKEHMDDLNWAAADVGIVQALNRA